MKTKPYKDHLPLKTTSRTREKISKAEKFRYSYSFERASLATGLFVLFGTMSAGIQVVYGMDIFIFLSDAMYFFQDGGYKLS